MLTVRGVFAGELRKYEAGMFTIYTDLVEDDAREARVRMLKMGEEYRRGTQEWFEAGRERLPFYLYRDEKDYLAAGGAPGSGGMFTGGRLMAVAGEHANLRTWQIVQHEGFHQFVRSAIGERLPVWLEEGLAEHFGESLFTGDGYVSGIMPPWRVERVKGGVENKAFASLSKLTGMNKAEWGKRISQRNYDQAWALVEYLMREKPEVLDELIKGGKLEENVEWEKWWAQLPNQPARELYQRVATETVKAFVERAKRAGQRIESGEELEKAIREKSLKMKNEEWLPVSLLEQAIELGKKMGGVTITP